MKSIWRAIDSNAKDRRRGDGASSTTTDYCSKFSLQAASSECPNVFGWLDMTERVTVGPTFTCSVHNSSVLVKKISEKFSLILTNSFPLQSICFVKVIMRIVLLYLHERFLFTWILLSWHLSVLNKRITRRNTMLRKAFPVNVLTF